MRKVSKIFYLIGFILGFILLATYIGMIGLGIALAVGGQPVYDWIAENWPQVAQHFTAETITAGAIAMIISFVITTGFVVAGIVLRGSAIKALDSADNPKSIHILCIVFGVLGGNWVLLAGGITGVIAR